MLGWSWFVASEILLFVFNILLSEFLSKVNLEWSVLDVMINIQCFSALNAAHHLSINGEPGYNYTSAKMFVCSLRFVHCKEMHDGLFQLGWVSWLGKI